MPLRNLNLIFDDAISLEVDAWMRCFPRIDEIKDILHAMLWSKASDPDGITVEILTFHWNTIRDDVLAEALHFFRNRCMLPPLNHTSLVLILKSDETSRLEDFRPISCLGVMYKMISKLLANRISTMFTNLIDPSQMAFVKGRRIINCTNLA